MLSKFRPGLPLTVCVLIALVVLVGLGTWQARKVGPKTELLERIQEGMAAPALMLSVHVDDPVILDYRHVYFWGEVLDWPAIKVLATNLKGKSGYHVYRPVLKRNGNVIPVNFGWVPFHLETLPVPSFGEDILVEGILRTSATPGSMTPPNIPEEGQWFTADVHEMAAFWGLGTKEYYHFRVMADHRGAPTDLPQGGQVRVNIPNDHLQYAITWYGLALTLIGVYVAYGIQRGRKSSENQT